MRSNRVLERSTRCPRQVRRSTQKRLIVRANSSVHPLLFCERRVGTMNVRLLGFRTLACGCVIGRYRELATSRELTYVEEKGTQCDAQGHRRNHTVSADRLASAATLMSAKAS